jgi:hypothetical protein
MLGVPDFFIENFSIPPFLLPIYQAAGIQYGVPWQVLAAINQIETDYGRDLATSSAGAVGWMQFLPSTWRRWGVAATGDGIADPYNPVDAIFTAARYLAAAGAARNLPAAIYAYNHAGWYVQSVLLRARLIGGIPNQLLSALSQLVQGRFPVAAKSTYKNPPAASGAIARSTGTAIYSSPGAPVIAVSDGRVLKIGHNATLGRYLVLEDQTGNTYIYSQLGSIQARYPVLKAPHTQALLSARALADIINPPHPPVRGPASAGSQPGGPTVVKLAHSSARPAGAHAAGAHNSRARRAHPAGRPTAGVATVAVKERLFANPSLPGSYAAGGAQQLNSGAQIQNFDQYLNQTLHLARNQYTLRALRPGAQVIAGTILGHLGPKNPKDPPHLYFQIRPAGPRSPLIDPTPILDDWRLLAASAAYQAAQVNPFFGPGAKNPTIGQMLLESENQISEQTLKDPNVRMNGCTRNQIKAEQIDPRVLKAVEYLSLSGLDPTIQALPCTAHTPAPNRPAATPQPSATILITAINRIAITKNQGPGTIVNLAIRRLLTLQGSLAPTQIISQTHIPGQPTTIALPGHKDTIQITYGFATSGRTQVQAVLKPHQWLQLITRISQIPEPTVPTTPNPYDIRTNIR